MNKKIENLDGVNAMRLKLISDVAKRVISKTQYTVGSGIISDKMDDEQFSYLVDQTIDKSLRLKNTSILTMNRENKIIVFKNGGLLETINISNPESRLHDIDVMGSTYGKSVSSFVTSVKNTLIPAMDKLQNCIESSIDKKSNEIKTGYELVKLDLPLLFENLDTHHGLVMTGDGSLPLSSASIPLPEVDDVRNWFLTDSVDINYDVEDLLLSTSNEELLKIWEKYFTDFSSTNVLLKDLSLLHYANIKDIALLYCVIRNFTTKTPDYVSNLATFKTNATTMFDYIKSVITKYINFYNLYSDTRVVQNIRHVKDLTLVYTFDKAYDTFLDKSVYGVDSILGFAILKKDDLLTSNVFISVENLLLEENTMQNAQKQFINITKLNAVKENRTKHIYAYKVMGDKVFEDIIKPLPLEVSKEHYQKIYNQTIMEVENESVETDIELFTLKFFSNLIPRVKRFFSITAQTEKLSDVETNKLTPLEIALYSTLELIVLELLDEVYVRDIPTYRI